MQIKHIIDAELYIDKGEVALATFDAEGDVQYKYSEPLYEMVSKYVSMFQIVGTDQFKLTPADLDELKELQLELDDALTLISTIIEEHS